MDYQNLYNTDSDFKGYVDSYCRDYGLTVEEALKHSIVRSVGENYAGRSGNNALREVIDCGC